MGWFGFGSGTKKCCCGAAAQNPCKLLEDAFDRADDDDLGGAWDEVAGDADIASQQLVVTTNNSQIIAHAANPDGPYTLLTATVILNSSGAVAQLFLGWASTGDYLYCRVSATAITVGKAGGASKSENVTITPNVAYTVTFCYTGQWLVGTIANVQAILAGQSASGNKHGLGAQTATVRFDNFAARKVAANCDVCTMQALSCSLCETKAMPRYFKLRISGVVSRPPGTINSCQNCEAVNGTWIFDMGSSTNGNRGRNTYQSIGCCAETTGPQLTNCLDAGGSVSDLAYLVLCLAGQNPFVPYVRYTLADLWVRYFSVGYSPERLGQHDWGTAATPFATLPVIPCTTGMDGLTLPNSFPSLVPCDVSSISASLELMEV